MLSEAVSVPEYEARTPVKAPRWLPPTATEPGPYALQGPRLVPSELRSALGRQLVGVRAEVRVQPGTRPSRPPRHPAPTSAERQHRRKTYRQRWEAHALPPSSRVRIRFRAYGDEARVLCEKLSLLA